MFKNLDVETLAQTVGCAAVQKIGIVGAERRGFPHVSLGQRIEAKIASQACKLYVIWNMQLPNCLSWVNPDQGIFPPPSTHTSDRTNLYWLSVRSTVERGPCAQSIEPGTCGVRIHYAIHSSVASSYFANTIK